MIIPVQRRAPSAANLMQAFKIDRVTADKVRLTIKSLRTAAGAVRSVAQSQWIYNHGVEELVKDKYALPSEWKDNVIATYMNTGDTYSATLIARNNSVTIGCWGDLAERYIKDDVR